MNVLLISVQKNIETVGLKYLQRYLLQHGHDAHLLYLPDFDPANARAQATIARFVSKVSPRLIGISLMSREFGQATELTRLLKREFPDIPVVHGGIHPTIAPEMCLESADYVCVGEGEGALLDLANALNNGSDTLSIPNLCFRRNGHDRRNPLRPLIDDLDRLPTLDHVPANGYILDRQTVRPLDWALFQRYAPYAGRTYSTITTRGCPYSCTYCCNNYVSRLYNSKRVRRRSVGDVIGELENVTRDKPQIECVNFQDDCFLACSEDYLEDFCNRYAERVGKPFVARCIPVYITARKMQLLADAGLSWISLGLQSGSDRVCREIYKRRSLREDFLKAARIINDHNVAAYYDVILDNPFESDEDRLATIETLLQTPRPFYAQFFSLSLFFGTELHERAIREGVPVDEDCRQKDFLVYRKNVLNDLTRLAAFLDPGLMRRLLRVYRRDPDGTAFKSGLFLGKLLSFMIVEPLTCFRVIYRAESGSWRRILRAVPRYLRENLVRYLNQFRPRTAV